MTDAEALVYQRYHEAGYTIYWKGWPDFLVVDEENRKHSFIEVKLQGDKLSYHQQDLAEILCKFFQLDTKIIKITKKDIAQNENLIEKARQHIKQFEYDRLFW